MYHEYDSHIIKFNQMYGLTCHDMPTDLGNQRLKDFKKILLDEIAEVDEIIEMTDPMERLVAIADWLGDLGVYGASESRRWGIPAGPVTRAIMESNFTKLGLDGKPIINQMGKVEKGPGYQRPEPAIREILFGS